MIELGDNRADDPLSGPPQDPTSALQVRQEIVGGAVMVHAVGDVDMATHELLDLQLQVAESQVMPPAPVVLDLTGVVFLVSIGGLPVHRGSQRGRERGGHHAYGGLAVLAGTSWW
jgi:hypothetical protein